MFLQKAMEAKKILDDYKPPKVPDFSKIAFELAVSLGRVRDSEPLITYFDENVLDIYITDEGEFYYTIEYSYYREEPQEDGSFAKMGPYSYKEEIYVPKEILNSEDPIAEAKLSSAIREMEYLTSCVESTRKALIKSTKEKEHAVTMVSSLLDGYSLDPVERVMLYVNRYTTYNPYDTLTLDVKSFMSISGIKESIEFAKIMAELLEKNTFKRIIQLLDSNGETIKEFNSYDDVPTEIFDPSLNKTITVLTTNLKTLYEYVG